LVVHDEWQGKGVGKALLHECVENAAGARGVYGQRGRHPPV
jgi:GNAT superfamily N-acetyltransferase